MPITFGLNQPQEEYKNPIFNSREMFGKYCGIYDPMILTNSAQLVNIENDIGLLRQQPWQLKTIIILDRYISKIINYYSCIACYKKLENKAIFIKIIEKYMDEYRIKEDKKSEISNKLANSLNSCILLKQYVFYTLKDGDSGWALILRGQQNYEPQEPIVGLGTTLPEADLNFVSQRIEQFKFHSSDINKLVELNTPVTKEEMLNACTQIDNKVKPESLMLKFKKHQGGFVETACLEISCMSDTRTFLLQVNYGSPRWSVTRYMDVNSIMISQLPVEKYGETLKEAYEKCESEYQRLKADPNALKKTIAQQEEMEEKVILDHVAEEGEYHISSLYSEYGEDAIPDRG